MKSPYYLGIDIGGTKISTCLFDKDFQLLNSERTLTQTMRTGSLSFIEDLKQLIQRNLTETINKIGISFNCVVNDGVIIASSLLGSFDLNYSLIDEFQKIFNRKVQLENDVNAHAIAEAKLGKGKDAHSFVLLNLGTGLRLSYVCEGHLLNGYTGNVGEISQSNIYVPEFDNKLKAQEVTSGKGLSKIYQHISGKKLSAEQIFKRYRQKEPPAQQTVNSFINCLANLFELVSYFYNPQLIIISGGLIGAAQDFLPRAISLYKNKTLPVFQIERITLSELENAACLGAVL